MRGVITFPRAFGSALPLKGWDAALTGGLSRPRGIRDEFSRRSHSLGHCSGLACPMCRAVCTVSCGACVWCPSSLSPLDLRSTGRRRREEGLGLLYLALLR